MTKQKRQKRTPQECPYCHKQFGNLKNHILMKHQAEQMEQPVELTREDLIGKKPKDTKILTESEPTTYICNNCKAELKKGENPCWQCGERLIWDGIA
jgi:hypothetical protein